MHILVENSGYDLANQGDIAMLQVAVARMHQQWPTATIQVITRAPERLARLCPSATPLAFHAAPSWYKQSFRKRLHDQVPAIALVPFNAGERFVRTSLPWLARQTALWNAKLHSDVELFLQADLVVATGGGYLTDSFEILALLVMDTLEIAARLGKPVALLGHGIGPLERPALRAVARRVLPMIDLIALRERRFGLPILRELGVPEQRITTIGDEAVGLAYDQRQASIGNGIGVNIRIASYADVDLAMAALLRETLLDAARRHTAPLVPVPIDTGSLESRSLSTRSDLGSIRELVGEAADYAAAEQIADPLDVIAQAARCRLVVTGSYHAAVFALSQGIPAVCLAKSAYYRYKFLGLADLFGPGCTVIELENPQVREQLAQAIDHAWEAAEALRPALLAAAEGQIAAAQAAYQRLFGLVNACAVHGQ
ncbi:MAG: polysaccharide pyruvyl transferase family protein [Roseiflexaceae bacterium]|nr:polysaccharide pyruvyl transferase family protein [Roseiflexaceae bacterium]